MSTSPLARLNPLDRPLLELVFRSVDDSMLREIAEADYGFGVEAHLEALLAIKNGLIPAPMEWEPHEVLAVTRWTEPDEAGATWECTGDRGHWKRLWACAVLIRAGAEPDNDNRVMSEDDTIIQLVASAMRLGHEASQAALQFLCWHLEYRVVELGPSPYSAVAAVLLCLFLDQSDSEVLHYLITLAKTEETDLSELFDDCRKSQTWKGIAYSLLIEPGALQSGPLNNELQRFGSELLGGTNS